MKTEMVDITQLYCVHNKEDYLFYLKEYFFYPRL